MIETEQKPLYICPNNHYVSYERYNYAKDFSDNLRDSDGRIMFENGLYCLSCNRAYGLSKIKEKKTSDNLPLNCRNYC